MFNSKVGIYTAQPAEAKSVFGVESPVSGIQSPERRRLGWMKTWDRDGLKLWRVLSIVC